MPRIPQVEDLVIADLWRDQPEGGCVGRLGCGKVNLRERALEPPEGHPLIPHLPGQLPEDPEHLVSLPVEQAEEPVSILNNLFGLNVEGRAALRPVPHRPLHPGSVLRLHRQQVAVVFQRNPFALEALLQIRTFEHRGGSLAELLLEGGELAAQAGQLLRGLAAHALMKVDHLRYLLPQLRQVIESLTELRKSGKPALLAAEGLTDTKAGPEQVDDPVEMLRLERLAPRVIVLESRANV